MKLCPRHVEDLVEDANARFPDDYDDYHQYYSIRCLCGDDRFTLLIGTKRAVIAVCGACGKELRIYDPAFYTSSTKLKGKEDFKPMPGIGTPTKIFIAYEYGETDAGDDFDRDDITWCSIFAEEGMTAKKVFEDETA